MLATPACSAAWGCRDDGADIPILSKPKPSTRRCNKRLALWARLYYRRNAPEVTIRAAVISDIDCLLQLMLGLQQDDSWSVPFREEVVRESLRELLVNPSVGRVFLIQESDSCVGYLVLSFDFSLEYGGKNAWVDELFIRPEFRGKGIGSKTLDFAVEAARDCGAKVLHLEVNRGNPAIDLYRRHGFEDHNRSLLSKWLSRKNEENP